MAELEMLSASTVAARLGVHIETIYDYCRKGKFPNAVRGEGRTGKWSIPTADVIAWNSPPPGLTMKEASAILGLSAGRLSEACRAKQLKAKRWRGRWIVQKEDLQDYDMWRKTRYDISYDILHNRDALWQCYVDSGYSFRAAAEMCRCSNTVFRMYFYEAGLEKLERVVAKAAPKKDRVIKCGRGCPSYMDCLEEGSVCLLDPDKVPLDTTPMEGGWTSAEFAISTS